MWIPGCFRAFVTTRPRFGPSFITEHTAPALRHRSQMQSSANPTASSSALQTLSSTVTIPQRLSLRGQAISALANIEYLVVQCSAGSRSSFRVDTYESVSKHRIPATGSVVAHALSNPSAHTAAASVPEDLRKADTSIERQYDEFVDVRRRMYNHVRDAHSSTPCGFCSAVTVEIVVGECTPSTILKLLGSGKKISSSLTKSINALLILVKGAGGYRPCIGQDRARQELFDFLFETKSL